MPGSFKLHFLCAGDRHAFCFLKSAGGTCRREFASGNKPISRTVTPPFSRRHSYQHRGADARNAVAVNMPLATNLAAGGPTTESLPIHES